MSREFAGGTTLRWRHTPREISQKFREAFKKKKGSKLVRASQSPKILCGRGFAEGGATLALSGREHVA